MKNARLLLKAVLLSVTLSCLCGCQAISDWWSGDHRDYQVGLFDFQWEPDESNRLSLVEHGGKVFYLKGTPLISSAYVERVELFDVKGGVGLRLHLSHHGMMQWHQASASFRGRQLAVMFDDKYRGPFRVDEINSSGIITLDGPYSREEAEKIRDHARQNFKR